MDRTYVILIAQVFNGCLLPLFASCLLLCLNDREFMAASPQSGLANLPLVACVTLTFVFTANVLLQVTMVQVHSVISPLCCLLQKIFGSLLASVYVRLGVAGAVGVASMAGVCLVTSLGRDIAASFSR